LATLLLHHSIFANHKTSAGHPERPDRYHAVEAVLGQSHFDALVREKAEVADLDTTRYVAVTRELMKSAETNCQGRVVLPVAGDGQDDFHITTDFRYRYSMMGM